MALREVTDYNTDNERIAAVLGFKKFVGHKINGRESGIIQWDYPPAYADLKTGTPQLSIPNFVGIVDHYLREHKHYLYEWTETTK